MNAPILLPSKLTDAARLHARLRVWASDVREQRPPYELVAPEAIAWAAMLCRVLDTVDVLEQSRRRSLLGLDRTKKLLLERLEELGLRSPAH